MAATTHVLELLTRALAKWEAGSRPSGTEVVRVLLEDAEEHAELIKAVVRHAGGVFLDAKECSTGVPAISISGKTAAPIDPLLRAAVREEFNIPLPGADRLRIDVAEHGGIVRASIAGAQFPAVSPGLTTVCGVAASLFSADLHQSPLAVIKYKESELDTYLAAAVWRLFTRQLEGVRIGRLDTLILLVEASSVEYNRHCARGSSLAYRLGSYGLERRKDWQTDLASIQRLQPQGKQPVVLFLGAGFSASSGLPLGDEARNSALRRMFRDVESRPIGELIDVFRGYVESEGRWLSDSEAGQSRDEFAHSLTLERVLREELFHTGVKASPTLGWLRESNMRAVSRPGRAVEALGRMMKRQRNLVIVTVNFDLLVEQIGSAEVFASDERFTEFPDYLNQFYDNGGPVPVLKLHGTLDELDTIVATVDQTQSGLSVPKTDALLALAKYGPRLPWVYVGYSMRDPDVEVALAFPPLYRHLDEHWVSPFTVPSAQRFTEKRRAYTSDEPSFWNRSITETADVFCEELARTWGA